MDKITWTEKQKRKTSFRKALGIEEEELKKRKGVVGEEKRSGEDCISVERVSEKVSECVHKMKHRSQRE